MRVPLSELITPARITRCGDRTLPVLSMTMHDGLVLQAGRFRKEIASRDKSQYKVVHRSQLVIGFPIDEGVLASQNVADEGIVSPAYDIWDINKERVLPEYLEVALRSARAIGYYKAKLKGTTARRRSLRKDDLLALSLSIPSFEVQRHQLNILAAIDTLLDARRRQLKQLSSFVQSRFIDMFGDKGYPPHPLSELSTTMQNGLSPSKNGDHHEKVLTLSAITQGNFDVSAWKEGLFKDDPPAGKRVADGCFYVCRGNGNKSLVGVGEYAPAAMDDLVYPDTMIAVRIDQEKVLLPYLRIAWKQARVREQIESSAKTTNGTYKINQASLGMVEVVVPPLSLQREFAAFAESVDKSQVAIKREIEKLETLKKALMQEYFG